MSEGPWWAGVLWLLSHAGSRVLPGLRMSLVLPHQLWASLGALMQTESWARSWSVVSGPTLPPPAQTLPGQAEGQTYSQKITLLASSASTQEDKTLQAEYDLRDDQIHRLHEKETESQS